MRRVPLLLAGLLLVAGLPPVYGQVEGDRGTLTDEHRTRGHRMLLRLRETLERYYYDSTYGGIDLARHVTATDSAIDAAKSLPEMFGALAQFLHALGDSHTRFFPPGITVSVQYGWSWIIIGDDCYVSWVQPKSDAEARGLRVGDRVAAIDGIQPTRANIRLISYVYYQLSPRPGMRLVVERDDGTLTEIVIKSEMKRLPPVRDYTNLEIFRRDREDAELARPRHRWKSLDSVLVWGLPRFLVDDQMIDRMMGRAREHRWLVLDLRGNPGGSVETELRLLGHFFAEPFDAYTEVWRDSTVLQRVSPRGRSPFTGQVIVLIDSRSASAAEITSRVLQLRGRATIVGDRSAGAVQTSYSIPLMLGTDFQERVIPFGMAVTINDVVMPDGNRLEQVGVLPNIAALPTGQDLAANRDPALQFALELAGVKVSAEDAGKLLER